MCKCEIKGQIILNAVNPLGEILGIITLAARWLGEGQGGEGRGGMD